jgi:hypothetical protein
MISGAFLPVRVLLTNVGNSLIATVKYHEEIFCAAIGEDKRTAVRNVVRTARGIRKIRHHIAGRRYRLLLPPI